jgi:hypothetical protein
MKKRPGECVIDYYDRLVLGDQKFDERNRQREAEWAQDRREREAVANKTWGMGCNE